jgi:hypothetical protein
MADGSAKTVEHRRLVANDLEAFKVLRANTEH